MANILITGASSGLGWSLALRYGDPEATLHLVARRVDRLQALSALLSDRGARPILHGIDVRDRSEMETLARRILEDEGPPSLIIANAGVRGPEEGNGAEAMRLIFDTNVMGVLNTIEPFLPAMKKAGNGRIAVIGSLASYRGLPKAGAYCASKAALAAWTDAIRYDAAPRGVSVSLINPGYIATEMTRNNPYPMPFVLSPDNAAQRIRAGIDQGRDRIAFPFLLLVLVRILALLPSRWGDRLLRAASKS